MQRIEQLDEAANFLMLISDQVIELTTTCQINANEALVLIQGVHAMIDKEAQTEYFMITQELENHCEKECHCGLYSDLASDQKLKDRLYQKAQKLPKDKLAACAIKTSEWFCKSKLLETLKSNSDASIKNPDLGL